MKKRIVTETLMIDGESAEAIGKDIRISITGATGETHVARKFFGVYEMLDGSAVSTIQGAYSPQELSSQLAILQRDYLLILVEGGFSESEAVEIFTQAGMVAIDLWQNNDEEEEEEAVNE